MARGKVLVVDDEVDLCQLLVEILAIHGFDAVGVYSGGEAIAKAADFLPDVVLLDMMLPDLDGATVCRRLCDPASAQRPKVLIHTCLSGHAERLQSFQAGADRYLCKPITPDDLIVEIDSLTSAVGEGVRRSFTFQIEAPNQAREATQCLIEVVSRSAPVHGDYLARFALQIGDLLNAAAAAVDLRSDGGLRVTGRVFSDRIELRLAGSPVEKIGEAVSALVDGAPGDFSLVADGRSANEVAFVRRIE